MSEKIKSKIIDGIPYIILPDGAIKKKATRHDVSIGLVTFSGEFDDKMDALNKGIVKIKDLIKEWGNDD